MTARVHRLVAQAFIPNLGNKPQVNHIDCDKANNHYTNLEWTTSQENIVHGITNGCRAQHYKRRYSIEDENAIHLCYMVGEGMTSLGRRYNVSRSCIYKILNFKLKERA